jgi:hypothetical protein
VFLFNAGKVFHASNGFSAPSVGEFLVSRKLITEETLDAALATQRLSDERKKLGAILVEMGAISHDALQKVLSDQMQDIAFEFLRWDSGFFNFKAIEGRVDPDKVFEDDDAKLTEVVNGAAKEGGRPLRRRHCEHDPRAPRLHHRAGQ